LVQLSTGAWRALLEAREAAGHHFALGVDEIERLSARPLKAT